ncbi:MAG: restriction endonuclease [Lachnospiraceae bacterium]|nr:restriction endonuclease [Lachnospiraceae bacterium]
MKGHFFHRVEIEKILDRVLNKTLGEVDVNNVFDKTKTNLKITGIAGDVIEQSVLGFPADNKQRPDLDIDGVDVELKTTGIRISKKETDKYEAKEPMSITAVSPNQIVLETFDTSNFWHKLKHMLIVYYHYAASKTVTAAEYADFYIRGYEFHEFSLEDEARLKNDWEIVKDFIVEVQRVYDVPENQYSRISSELRDKLVYIDTAPKWPNSPRFRLKRHVVTEIVQNHFGDKLEQLPGKYNGYRDIDAKCHDITKEDGGKTVKQLIYQYNVIVKDINKVSKSVNESIIIKMFGGQSRKLNQIELFRKFGIIGKSITMTKTKNRTEDTKLFAIEFNEWTDDKLLFEESSLYDYFTNHQFLYMIFEEPSIDAPLSENKFIGFKRLTFSDDFIQREVKKLWNEVRSLIFEKRLTETIILDKEGKPYINSKTGVYKTSINFPKSRDNVLFVRGGGLDSSVKTEEVNEIKMYRQYVWIKGTYIVQLLNDTAIL